MISRIRLFAFIISSVLLVLVTAYGCKDDNNYSTNPPGGNPGANEVWMQGNTFNPASKTVAAGTAITWTNKDQTLHTVTSGTPGAANGLFNSGNMSGGATFTYTFDTTGTFRYFCIIHGSMMTGTIIVQ